MPVTNALVQPYSNALSLFRAATAPGGVSAWPEKAYAEFGGGA